MGITLNEARQLATKILAAPDEERLYEIALELIEAKKVAEAAAAVARSSQPVRDVDADTMLVEIRRLARKVLDKPRLYEDEAVALAENLDVLDAYLSAAGDLPEDWS